MNKSVVVPTSLLEAIKYFSDPDIALTTFAAFRWPDGVATCPACMSKETSFLKTRRIWKCKDCAKQFSAKVGTLFEDSPVPLSKWMPALWLCVNSNGISSCELARALGVTQKTAWFMLHRIRLALHEERNDQGNFSGHVEADETFIGGAARFMHKDRRKRVVHGTGPHMSGKSVVMGLLERHGLDGRSRVRAQHIGTTKRRHTQGYVRNEVEAGSTVYTDALMSYSGLDSAFKHHVIDHAECYAKGKIHTNGLENFWSLLKRGIRGTYVSVEPFHLFRYLDEQVYRFNNRKTKDVARFIDALKGLIGKRLTYTNLIGEATT